MFDTCVTCKFFRPRVGVNINVWTVCRFVEILKNYTYEHLFRKKEVYIYIEKYRKYIFQEQYFIVNIYVIN